MQIAVPTPQAQIRAAYELIDRGALAEAEAACQRALAATFGNDPAAWTVLGVVLREQGRATESEAAYRRALQIEPNHTPAHHNLGALLSQLERAEEALVSLDRARDLGLSAPELHINRGRTLAQLYRLEEAENCYAHAAELQPRSPVIQSNLAQIRYMRGDPDFARDLAAAARNNAADRTLQLTYAQLLRGAGAVGRAELALRALLKMDGGVPETRAILAELLHETGRLREAEGHALHAATDKPHNPAFISSLVAIELALGKPDAALPFIRAQRQRQPLEQRWIAYEATAARLMADPLYVKLYDYQRLVRVYQLEAPPGWTSMEELNSALVKALAVRHCLAAHPLDQSMRNGSQTARSLLTEADAAIQGLIHAFVAPLADYRAALGNAIDHPLSARNRGDALFRGCWSVELRRNGFHVNHIHPEGWLSSAYYVSVPTEVSDHRSRSGWLKFGEPRLPVPGATADFFVEPRAGQLALFPSYMWHGTNPILGDRPRLTVAFDAVPAARKTSA